MDEVCSKGKCAEKPKEPPQDEFSKEELRSLRSELRTLEGMIVEFKGIFEEEESTATKIISLFRFWK